MSPRYFAFNAEKLVEERSFSTKRIDEAADPSILEDEFDYSTDETLPENSEKEPDMVLESAINAPVSADAPPKKKKSKAQRGIGKPNGFEPYHADNPLTPTEHAEDQSLYNPETNPFATRIMTAIQRFETRRRLDSERRDYFYKYLIFGGIDVGPNMFQGVAPRELKEMDKEQAVESRAQTSLRDDVGNGVQEGDEKYVVDFEGVMKGFLSRRVPHLYALDTSPEVEKITSTLKNFLNYLMHHDVCPEYQSDILAARRVCDTATTQLWSCHEAARWLPGDFNIACSTLFGGEYGKNYNPSRTEWNDDARKENSFIGMTERTAAQVVRFALAAAGGAEYEGWMKEAKGFSLKVDWEEDEMGLEVVEVVRPEEELKKFYRDKSRNFRAVGRLKAVRWTNPSGNVWDLTAKERALVEQKKAKVKQGEVVEFFVEDQVLQYCFVGMKIEADVKHVNSGIWFLDRVYRVYCSFDRYLANERMLEWRDDKVIAPKGSMEDIAEGDETMGADKVNGEETNGHTNGNVNGAVDGDVAMGESNGHMNGDVNGTVDSLAERNGEKEDMPAPKADI
ncbi:MAG: hypothetical protein Q9227_005269 [Pyrenula ochraceoflavens]